MMRPIYPRMPRMVTTILPYMGEPPEPVDPTMTFEVTTTGAAQTFTLNAFTVTEAVEVDWGDSLSNVYTGSGTRTHVYAAAGTYVVTIDKPQAVTHFDLRDTKTSTILGAQVSKLVNATNLRFLNITALNWTVNAAAPMPANVQYLQLEQTPNVSWVIDASNPMPPINDVLNLRGMNNVVWADGSAIKIPPLVESLTIRACPQVTQMEGLELCADLSIVRIENTLTQALVDKFFDRVYQKFPTRAVTGGTILIASTNAAPSGTHAAMCPPTTGKARAFELLNDSCGVSANHWAGITFTA